MCILTEFSSESHAQGVAAPSLDLTQPSSNPTNRLPEDAGALLSGSALRSARASFETEFIVRALNDYRGNISQAAKALGMSRRSLQLKMQRLGIGMTHDPVARRRWANSSAGVRVSA